MENILTAISLIFQPYVMMIIAISAIYGLFVGSIPGLTATMATALLVPVTFFMDPVPALAAIVTMEAMAIFAGDIPGALVRIPGTPSSAAYVDESYTLTQKGRAGFVLGVDVTDRGRLWVARFQLSQMDLVVFVISWHPVPVSLGAKFPCA